jgi:hypothetical protein
LLAVHVVEVEMLLVTSTSAALAAPVITTDAARMAAILMGVVLGVSLRVCFTGAEGSAPMPIHVVR